MAFTDNRTTNLNLPLPNVDNDLETDVQRLIEAISGLDGAVHGLQVAMPSDQSSAITSLAQRMQQAESALSTQGQAISSLQQMRGAANGLASLDANSKIPTAQLPSHSADLVTSGKFDVARIPELTAGQTTSGTFHVDRIPSLGVDKLTSGTLPVARGGTGVATVAAGSFLTGNGADAMNVRTAAQVLGDIGAMPASGGTMTGSLSVNGDITATGNVSGYSDRRLKKSIKPIKGALEKVRKLRGVTFTMRSTNQAGIGLVAQEVREVVPAAVVETNGYLSVAYGNLGGLLAAALNELAVKVDAIEARAA